MIAKFNLYDFIANLVPGLTFLWVAEQMGGLVGWKSPLPLSGELAETSILIVLSYVTGLMLQALAERVTEKQVLFRIWGGFPSAIWLLPDDKRFSAEFKRRILELITERFKVATVPEIPEGTTAKQERVLRLMKNQELFYLCYNHVDNLSPRPQTFNAQYGLFRCLVTTFAILSVLALGLGVWQGICRHRCPGKLIGVSVLLAGLTFLAYARCKKRGEDFAKSIYDLFVAGVASAPPGEEKK